MKLIIKVDPMGTVRMTAGMVKRLKWNLYEPGDKRVERVQRYLGYKQYLSTIAKQHVKDELLTGPIYLDLIFYMPMPVTWSIKKKVMMEGKPHTSKPDRDNLEKGVCDAFNKIIWKDDGQVCDGRTRKFYSREPRIEVEIKRLDVVSDGVA